MDSNSGSADLAIDLDANMNDVEFELEESPLISPSPSPSPVEAEKEVAPKKLKRLSQSQVSSIPDLTDNPNKRKLTSSVWNDMVKKTVRGETIALCKHCNKILKANSANGTTHLRNHLNRCLQRKKQSDIRQSLLSMEKKAESESGSGGGTTVELGKWSFNQEAARKKLAMAIIAHEYPILIVEHERFREFVNSIQPLFRHVSRTTMRKEIFGIYNEEKEKLRAVLKGLNSRVAITMDMWTSNQKRGFMTVTAHFVDSNWTLQSRLLNFVYVPTPHTSDVIATGLFNSLMSWSLDKKLSTITVDNCTTNDAMITNLQLKLRKDELVLRGKVFHMRCCAHILNLIVKDGVSIIEKSIERIRDSVAYWSATPSRVEKFGEACKQLDVSFDRKLVLDCKTRWNSTYDMLATAIDYREVFDRIQYLDRHYKSVPSDDDWDLADEICKKLVIFYEVTNLFSGTQYPTVNYYFEKVYEIREALIEWKDSLDLNISTMADRMFVKFEKYWGDVHIVMAICAILDPRYKLRAVEFMFRAVYAEEASVELEKLKSTLYELIQEYQWKDKSRNHRSMGSSSSLVPVAVGHEKKISKMRLYLNNFPIDDDSEVRSELDRYLQEAVLPFSDDDDDFDILHWWKQNGVKYPTMQSLAKDMLAIPVSTVASESAFSTSGRVISSYRSRLNPNTIEALMCAQSWISNGKIGFEFEISELENELGKLQIHDDDTKAKRRIRMQSRC